MTINLDIASQYHAALDMLSQAVVKCPDELWDDTSYKNTFCRVAYHTLFYVHLYLQPSRESFVAWVKHKDGYQRLERWQEPYRKQDILEYADVCHRQAEQQLAALQVDAPSGFSWLPFNKLELQFYNIRHLQQHIGELCERLGATGDIEIDWVSSGKDA